MRLTVAVFSFFITIMVFSQEKYEALNFEEGIELAHYNYLNESLSISDKELESFWDGYEEMKESEAEIKARQHSIMSNARIKETQHKSMKLMKPRDFAAEAVACK
mgnify:CR=1 FL=1